MPPLIDALVLIAAICYLLAISWQMTIAALILTPLALISLRFAGRHVQAATRRLLNADRAMAAELEGVDASAVVIESGEVRVGDRSMPIRDVVIFPHMMTPFVVGRESSVRALEEALATDKKIFLATQHEATVDEPRPDEIYQGGTVANIVQSVRTPDGNIKVLVEGLNRVKKHQRPNPVKGQTGGIIDKEMPIHISNVMLVNPATGKGDRVGFKFLEAQGGQVPRKVRFFKSNGEVVDV
jgi:ribosomal protein L24